MSVRQAQELMELKQQAMEYYQENGVPQKMEEILNSTFYDRPDDVYGHLANYFEEFAAVPKITKVICREALDGKGQSALQTDMYCRIKNKEKLVSSCLSSNVQPVLGGAKPVSPEDMEARRHADVTTATGLINTGSLQDALKDINPTQQSDVDALLMNTLTKLESDLEDQLRKEAEEKEASGAVSEGEGEPIKSSRSADSKSKGAKSPKGKGKGPAVTIIPDEPRESLFYGSSFVSAISQAAAVGGAYIQDEEMYRYIARLYHEQIPEKFSVPLPMTTILMSGKAAPGKLNAVQEFMVVPAPSMPMKESLYHIRQIYNHCAKVLSAKTGVTGKATNELGALWTAFDRPEQGLEMLQEAITQIGLTPGEHFNIALNCAGHELFDYDKGKYEVVTGQQKLGEDLADYWGDILTRYPSVICLIDPMRSVEREAWLRLAERVSERCYIAADACCPRPGLLKDADVSELKISAAVLRQDGVTSVSDVINAAKTLHDAETQTIVSSGMGESTDSFIVDLAVACGARFIKVGAPCRGERVVKLNRLLQIESALESTDTLAAMDAHTFPLIKPPTPPPQPEEGAGDDTKSTDNESEKHAKK